MVTVAKTHETLAKSKANLLTDKHQLRQLAANVVSVPTILQHFYQSCKRRLHQIHSL